MANTKAVTFDKQIPLRVDQAFLDALEEIRGRRRPIPSRAEVIREAVFALLDREPLPVHTRST